MRLVLQGHRFKCVTYEPFLPAVGKHIPRAQQTPIDLAKDWKEKQTPDTKEKARYPSGQADYRIGFPKLPGLPGFTTVLGALFGAPLPDKKEKLDPNIENQVKSMNMMNTTW